MEKRAIASTSMLSISPTLRFFLSNINYFCTASCMEYKHKKIFISLCILSHQVLTADFTITYKRQFNNQNFHRTLVSSTFLPIRLTQHHHRCTAVGRTFIIMLILQLRSLSQRWRLAYSHMVISSTVETRMQVSQVQHSF